MFWIIFFLILGIGIFLFVRSKKLKLPNVYLITGGVKTVKSFLSVALAIKQYKKNYRMALIKRVFQKLFNLELSEIPMLYSNMKLRNIKYNLFTVDMLERRVRIPYKSVVLIDEASLLADSMSYKNDDINERLMLFVKLFGHYSKGGTMIINTQSLHDMHFSFKRGISTYLWIHSKTKLPFITKMKVQEMMFSDDTNKSVNVNITGDIEESTKDLFILNKYYKYYDCFCYSIFTDSKPIYVNYENKVLTRHDSLKTPSIVSVREFKSLKDYETVKLPDTTKIKIRQIMKGELIDERENNEKVV